LTLGIPVLGQGRVDVRISHRQQELLLAKVQLGRRGIDRCECRQTCVGRLVGTIEIEHSHEDGLERSIEQDADDARETLAQRSTRDLIDSDHGDAGLERELLLIVGIDLEQEWRLDIDQWRVVPDAEALGDHGHEAGQERTADIDREAVGALDA